MSMVVNTNTQALNSYRNLKVVSDRNSKSSEKLSSGYRINRAADDAAGLAISEKMRTQIRGLDRASSNSQDGISMIQTAEGALQETQDILQRMRELTLQASNETLTTGDREKIALELNELSDEIDSISEKTEFNTKKLIDGSWAKESIYLQTGANASQGMTFNISKMSAKALGVTKQDIGTIVAGGGVAGNSNTINLRNSIATTIDLGVDNDASSRKGTYVLESGIEITINQEEVELHNGVKTVINTITFSEDVTFAALGDRTYTYEDVDSSSGTIVISTVTTTAYATNYSVGLTIKAGTYTTDQLTAILAQAYDATDTVGVYDGDRNTNFDHFVLLDTSTNTRVELTASGLLTIGGAGGSGNASTLFTASAIFSMGLDLNRDVAGDFVNTHVVNWTKGNNANIDSLDLGYEVNFDNQGNASIVFSQAFRDLISSIDMASYDTDQNAGNEEIFNMIRNGEAVGVEQLANVEITMKTGEKLEFSSTDKQDLTIAVTTFTEDLGTYGRKTNSGSTAAGDSVGENISKLVDKIDSALEEVSMQRAKLGAYQNRLEHTIKNLDVSSENLSAAESRIRDTDMAKEMMEYTQAQVLQQAGTTMLAQANTAPQSVLQLLG